MATSLADTLMSGMKSSGKPPMGAGPMPMSDAMPPDAMSAENCATCPKCGAKLKIEAADESPAADLAGDQMDAGAAGGNVAGLGGKY